MAFLEIQFPDFDSISMPAKGGPMFNTGIITAASGFEQRNGWWSMPRRKWDIANSALNEAEKDAVVAFFHVAAGKLNGFRKRDWADFELNQGIIGTGTGVATTFQLKKTYTVGGQSMSVDIKKPVTASVVDYANVAQENTVRIWFGSGSPLVYAEQLSGWTVNHATGVVTFLSAPGGGTIIKASCEYDIPVRFDTDAIEVTLTENRLPTVREDGIYTFASIPLVEVRV
jgi:uncharacterized protein (TIGR02217 family)